MRRETVRGTIVRLRLANQRIAGKRCASPAQAVAGLGAVQAQDYEGALWKAPRPRTAGSWERTPHCLATRRSGD